MCHSFSTRTYALLNSFCVKRSARVDRPPQSRVFDTIIILAGKVLETYPMDVYRSRMTATGIWHNVIVGGGNRVVFGVRDWVIFSHFEDK